MASIVYQKGSNAETGYFFARNLMGDVIAVYRSSDSTLIGTYEYDLWGRPISVIEASAGIDTDGILEKNPIRYRGYYYDNETGFYNLKTRYYDPEIRRFISADSTNLLSVATTSLNCKNLFNYCENNPINSKDSKGTYAESGFDVATWSISYFEFCANPDDEWVRLNFYLDSADVFLPGICFLGECCRGVRGTIKSFDTITDWFSDIFKFFRKSDVDDVAEVAVKGGSSWVRNLKKTSDLNIDDFRKLKDNGVVKVNLSGSNRPLTGVPNSYYKTGNGEHIFVYDENGKLIYDISSERIKAFKINVDPDGVEHYQAYKLEGIVPDEIKEIFGW